MGASNEGWDVAMRGSARRACASAAAVVCVVAALAGCASAPAGRGSGIGDGVSSDGSIRDGVARSVGVGTSAWADASRFVPADTPRRGHWEHFALPGKAHVEFVGVRDEGRSALSATAVSAASVVRKRLRLEPHEIGRLRFSWKVPQLIADADLARRDADDSPVRIILAFEGDRSRLSPKDAMLSELTRVLTGEEMPYATLMYVWCNQREPGSVLRNPRTDRIRKIVLESGPARLDRWLDYERDVRADFERAFGEAPGALVGVAIMTDSDNTQSTARALYGPVRHHFPGTGE